MNAYRILGDQAGTPEARDLAADLQLWHDAMVMHQRGVEQHGALCDDECPHSQAAVLWPLAVAAFGDRASELVLLRRHGTAAQGHRMAGGGAPIRS